jgi:hypothetical protein
MSKLTPVGDLLYNPLKGTLSRNNKSATTLREDYITYATLDGREMPAIHIAALAMGLIKPNDNRNMVIPQNADWSDLRKSNIVVVGKASKVIYSVDSDNNYSLINLKTLTFSDRRVVNYVLDRPLSWNGLRYASDFDTLDTPTEREVSDIMLEPVVSMSGNKVIRRYESMNDAINQAGATIANLVHGAATETGLVYCLDRDDLSKIKRSKFFYEFNDELELVEKFEGIPQIIAKYPELDSTYLSYTIRKNLFTFGQIFSRQPKTESLAPFFQHIYKYSKDGVMIERLVYNITKRKVKAPNGDMFTIPIGYLDGGKPYKGFHYFTTTQLPEVFTTLANKVDKVEELTNQGVITYNLNGDVNARYNTINEASEALGLTKMEISRYITSGYVTENQLVIKSELSSEFTSVHVGNAIYDINLDGVVINRYMSISELAQAYEVSEEDATNYVDSMIPTREGELLVSDVKNINAIAGIFNQPVQVKKSGRTITYKNFTSYAKSTKDYAPLDRLVRNPQGVIVNGKFTQLTNFVYVAPKTATEDTLQDCSNNRLNPNNKYYAWKDGEIVYGFKNMSDVKRLLNISDQSHIHKNLKGIRPIAFGYSWSTSLVKTEKRTEYSY